MMEIAAARAAMEEQTARRAALRGEAEEDEDAKGEDGNAAGGAGSGVGLGAPSIGLYNKV